MRCRAVPEQVPHPRSPLSLRCTTPSAVGNRLAPAVVPGPLDQEPPGSAGPAVPSDSSVTRGQGAVGISGNEGAKGGQPVLRSLLASCPGGDRSGERQGTSLPVLPLLRTPGFTAQGLPSTPCSGCPPPWSGPWREVWKLGRVCARPPRPTHQQAQQLRPEGPRAERGHGQSGGGSALMVTLRISYMVRARPLPPPLSLGHSQVPSDPGSAKGDLPPAPAVCTRCQPARQRSAPGPDVGSRPAAPAGPARPPARPHCPSSGRGRRAGPGARTLRRAPRTREDGRAARPRADQAPVLVMGSRRRAPRTGSRGRRELHLFCGRGRSAG